MRRHLSPEACEAILAAVEEAIGASLDGQVGRATHVRVEVGEVEEALAFARLHETHEDDAFVQEFSRAYHGWRIRVGTTP